MDVVRPGWVASMRAALADANLVGGVFDFCALGGAPSSFLVHAATLQLGFLPFGLSANVAVPREVFDGLQGFDEELSPEEDVDPCWRLQLAGHRFALATDAVVEKRERAAGLPTFRGAWARSRFVPAGSSVRSTSGCSSQSPGGRWFPPPLRLGQADAPQCKPSVRAVIRRPSSYRHEAASPP